MSSDFETILLSRRTTTTEYSGNKWEVAEFVGALLAMGNAWRSITITRPDSSGDSCAFSVTSEFWEQEVLQSSSPPPRTSAIPLPGAHSGATSSPPVDHLKKEPLNEGDEGK